MEMEKSNQVWCVIPARGGSKGIHKKNIVPIAGKPLICYTIEYALTCNDVDKVIVSTDNQEIANIAIENGALVPELRPKELSTDTSLIPDAYWHGVDITTKCTGITPEKIIVLYPTSPFRPPSLLNEIVAELNDSIIYLICQKISHERGCFVKSEDNLMKYVYSGKGFKQMGLAFGIRYCPPGCRPYQKDSTFAQYARTLKFSGGGTSLRIFEEYCHPWDIDIDTHEDIALAEYYLTAHNRINPS